LFNEQIHLSENIVKRKSSQNPKEKRTGKYLMFLSRYKVAFYNFAPVKILN
jgi:hypothetical protein